MLMQLDVTVKKIRRVLILLLPPYDRGRVSDVSVCVTMTSLIARASLITWRRQEICIDRSRGGKVRNIDHRSIQSRVREREKEREEKIKTEETWGITENRERLNQNLPISVSLMTNLVLTSFLEWVHCILSCCPFQYGSRAERWQCQPNRQFHSFDWLMLNDQIRLEKVRKEKQIKLISAKW